MGDTRCQSHSAGLWGVLGGCATQELTEKGFLQGFESCSVRLYLKLFIGQEDNCLGGEEQAGLPPGLVRVGARLPGTAWPPERMTRSS